MDNMTLSRDKRTCLGTKIVLSMQKDRAIVIKKYYSVCWPRKILAKIILGYFGFFFVSTCVS
jgi:hypothetical protein